MNDLLALSLGTSAPAQLWIKRFENEVVGDRLTLQYEHSSGHGVVSVCGYGDLPLPWRQ